MPQTFKAAATITIHAAPDMTPEGKHAIAEWMRKMADYLEEFGNEMTQKKFQARHQYPEEESPFVFPLNHQPSPAQSNWQGI